MERHTTGFDDKYEKTDTPMIFSFTPIKQFDIHNVNYSCGIELSSFDCIIHNDLNSLLPAMSKTNMKLNYHLDKNKHKKDFDI